MSTEIKAFPFLHRGHPCLPGACLHADYVIGNGGESTGVGCDQFASYCPNVAGLRLHQFGEAKAALCMATSKGI
ncbi:hypothetical protein [Stenotrophomonas maltophilia]|uniref:hypothetical protein n=1 Tax=Stenotrophomonas TaxID=40323 RepID=UPI0011B431CC|nr:hypothetical protein [Stenotrophomonas maltophilia]